MSAYGVQRVQKLVILWLSDVTWQFFVYVARVKRYRCGLPFTNMHMLQTNTMKRFICGDHLRLNWLRQVKCYKHENLHVLVQVNCSRVIHLSIFIEYLNEFDENIAHLPCTHSNALYIRTKNHLSMRHALFHIFWTSYIWIFRYIFTSKQLNTWNLQVFQWLRDIFTHMYAILAPQHSSSSEWKRN